MSPPLRSPEDRSWLSRAGQLETLTQIRREKVLLSSSVPRAAPFHELQGDKVLPSGDSFKQGGCISGTVSKEAHCLNYIL